MTTQEKDRIEVVIEKLEDLHVELQTVKRGVYGDEKNKVKGLIQTDIELHERITKLEEVNKKAVWYGLGFVGAFELGWHLFKSKLGL